MITLLPCPVMKANKINVVFVFRKLEDVPNDAVKTRKKVCFFEEKRSHNK